MEVNGNGEMPLKEKRGVKKKNSKTSLSPKSSISVKIGKYYQVFVYNG